MNRADRRKLPTALRGIADNLHRYRCPDCNNDTQLRQDTYGVWHLEVLHDDTCPTLTAIERNGE